MYSCTCKSKNEQVTNVAVLYYSLKCNCSLQAAFWWLAGQDTERVCSLCVTEMVRKLQLVTESEQLNG